MSNVNSLISTVSAGDSAIVLGRIPDLSAKEVELSLKRSGRSIALLNVTSGVALVKADPTPDAAWFQTLGGATKFGTVLDIVPAESTAFLESVRRLVGQRKRIGLSASGLGGQRLRELGQMLKLDGLTRRFVTPTSGTMLSAAQSKQFRKAVDAELLVLPLQGQWVVILIESVQDIDDFTRRDRGAPFQHGLRGMLPTKLARTMVNLGLGLIPQVQHPRLLDPFCGTGRVIMEGMLLGAQVWGSDIDPIAIEATRGNLDWLCTRYELLPEAWPERLIVSDVADLPTYLQSASIDCIVTEPDLGPPQTRPLGPSEAGQVLSTLKPTYEHLLQAADHVLAPMGVIVTVLPVIGNQSLRERMVDSLEQFGYHALDSFLAAREDQFVSREIVILTKKP